MGHAHSRACRRGHGCPAACEGNLDVCRLASSGLRLGVGRERRVLAGQLPDLGVCGRGPTRSQRPKRLPGAANARSTCNGPGSQRPWAKEVESRSPGRAEAARPTPPTLLATCMSEEISPRTLLASKYSFSATFSRTTGLESKPGTEQAYRGFTRCSPRHLDLPTNAHGPRESPESRGSAPRRSRTHLRTCSCDPRRSRGSRGGSFLASGSLTAQPGKSQRDFSIRHFPFFYFYFSFFPLKDDPQSHLKNPLTPLGCKLGERQKEWTCRVDLLRAPPAAAAPVPHAGSDGFRRLHV